MRKKSLNNKKRITVAAIYILCLLAIYVSVNYGLIYNTRINSGAPQVTSDQELTCYWTLDTTTIANVTWYKVSNGTATQNRTQNDISCNSNNPCSTSGNGNIPQSFTTRGEIWKCEVRYFNSTDIEYHNESVQIINSPPTPPIVYLQNGTDTTNITAVVPEDNTTYFQVNSTDADGDTLTYTLNDTTFCTINATSGALTCSPTQESHIRVWTLHIGAQDSSSAQFIDFYINVTSNNDAPYFSPSLSDQEVTEGEALNYTITAADNENDVPINFSMSTNLSSLIIVNTSSTTASIRFNNSGIDQATFSDRGNYTITITIRDSGNPSRNSTSTFDLEVIPNNHLPNVTIVVYNNNSLIQGGNLSIFLNATDIDNDTLSFTTNHTALYNVTYSSTNYSNVNYSYAFGWINVTAMNNSYVLARHLRITVYDGKENYTTSISLDINNTNDAPTIHELSYNSGNNLNNVNISNLSGYTGVALSYYVNGSDPDSATYEGEVFSYSTNDSNFTINDTTGRLYFTPSTAGNFSFMVTISDDQGLTFNRTANLNVIVNTNPRFTESNIVIQCHEYDTVNYAQNCTYNMSSNVTDDDVSDYVSTYWTNSSIFSINSNTGIINFAASQTAVGNYSILVNITDTRGGMNYTTINLIVNNTNNAPTINDTVLIPSERMRIGTSYSIRVYADDSDLSLASTYENLTFNMTITGQNSSIFALSKISDTEASVDFTPQAIFDAGNYTINFTVRDYFGNMSSVKTVNFFIYNLTNNPVIANITPHGTPLVNGSVSTSWANTTSFPSDSTNITIDENSTYVFNQTTILDTSYPNEANYSWIYDGTNISHANYTVITYNFSSSGSYVLQLLAEDDFNYVDNFTWYITVNNVNRAPRLVNPLANLTVNGTTTYNNYMSYYNSQTKFIDDDDDLDGDNRTNGNESTLDFSATSCGSATFTFIETDLKVTTTSVGECYVNFTAADALNSSLNVTSYLIFINITEVSNDTTETPTPTPTSSGGGGGSSTRTITLPVPLDVEKPRPLQLITPKLVTIYKNATIKVPILINNTWNDTLRGVGMSVYTNASNVSLYLDRRYFPAIAHGVQEEINLIISNYKSEGHYEIQIIANVTDPEYREIGTIFVNSAEMRSEGEELENKISFARDLLSSNPECQELTELLNEAKKQLDYGNLRNTAQLVDDVINGCRYLVSSANKVEEKPTTEFIKNFEWRSKYNDYLIIGGFAVLFLISMIYLVKKDKDEDY
jgi:hypothetical protein